MPETNKDEDARYTIVVVGDDGKYYKLTRGEWRKNEVTDAAGLGVINQLTEFGAYVSYVPPELAVGIGQLCIVLNLKAILENKIDEEE